MTGRNVTDSAIVADCSDRTTVSRGIVDFTTTTLSYRQYQAWMIFYVRLPRPRSFPLNTSAFPDRQGHPANVIRSLLPITMPSLMMIAIQGLELDVM